MKFGRKAQTATFCLSEGALGLQIIADDADRTRVKRPVQHFLVTLVALVCLTFGAAVPASAGTLTAATFTAPAGWNTTGASNARYDWAFTTATTGTVSKVTTSVPPGTGSKNRYLALNGGTGNYASTPSSPANSFNGPIDIRLRINPTNWSPSGPWRNLLSKSHLETSWALKLVNGPSRIAFWMSPDGSTGNAVSNFSSPLGIQDGTTKWVRVTAIPNNGSGQRQVAFYVSDDGNTWTQVGSTQYGAATAIATTSAPVEVGSYGSGSVDNFSGGIFQAELRNGVNGPVVNKFDPNEAAAQSPSSWTSSTGETWNINRNGTNQPADIASDLSVGPVEGLPTGGSANYRFIDGIATYNLPTPTSVNAGTSVKLNLGGFTNTATPGSYASTIRTFDSAGPPVEIDNATTGALTFTTASNTAATTVTVDPSLTATVSGLSSACLGVSPSTGTVSTATSLSLGRLSTTGTSTVNQRYDVSTNGTNGFMAFLRSPNNLRTASGQQITPLTALGPGASANFPAVGTEAFGMRMGWWPNDVWARTLSYNSDQYMSRTTSGASNTCASYRAQAGPNTPAGSYQTTLIFTVVARY